MLKKNFRLFVIIFGVMALGFLVFRDYQNGAAQDEVLSEQNGAAQDEVLSESIEPQSKTFEYLSGNIDAVIFCGTEAEGFEIFLGKGFDFNVSNITGRQAILRFRMDQTRLESLVVPIRNGQPVYDAMTRHVRLDQKPEFYYMHAGFYLNRHDYGGLGAAIVTYAAPDFKLYRDGSKLATLISSDRFWPHPDSLASNSIASPCEPISGIDPMRHISERLSGFGQFMEERYNAIQADIRQREDASRF